MLDRFKQQFGEHKKSIGSELHLNANFLDVIMPQMVMNAFDFCEFLTVSWPRLGGFEIPEVNRIGQLICTRVWQVVHLPKGDYDMQLTEDKAPTKFGPFIAIGPWDRTVYRLHLLSDHKTLKLDTVTKVKIDVITGKELSDTEKIAPRTHDELNGITNSINLGISVVKHLYRIHQEN